MSCGGGVEKSTSTGSEGADKVEVQDYAMDLEKGKLVYNRNCKVCHQADGKGVPGYYPPIFDTKNSNGDKNYLVKVVLFGLRGRITVEGEVYNGVMANYHTLKDKDIADLLNYVRSQGKSGLPKVLPDEVARFR